ncbi:RnfH family protein [Vibrio salinus]|uniref:RnfH family protein n=1 Tax=Vibrio salinus TaxID=2899784 RepID=UPI001E593695|nr:RnfH family protein [Vibrio salinus]MCE0493104.1 RnfH family protein [Vibrio salinus]
MNAESDTIQVEVAYALPHEQRVISLVVESSMSVEDIIKQSGIIDVYPEIDLTKNKVGVFGRTVKLDSLVRNKDRIEIYRPLIADPKEIRRKRAEEARKKAKAANQ